MRLPASPVLMLLALLLAGPPVLAEQERTPPKVETLELWHTFAVNSENERIIEESVDAFEARNPNVRVNVVRIPYMQNLQQFINASQGGEAPDLIRVSDSEVGKIGHISVEGLPLLEDLRPHITPAQRSRFEPRALQAMRYGDPLYALPVSQVCLALVYNKALFDGAGLAYPRDDWSSDEMIAAAEQLTADPVKGLAIPRMWSFWYLPFIAAFGGRMFDDDGNPTLNSAGTATAMDWFLSLYRDREIMLPGLDIEGMTTQFKLGRAAMILDGPWALNGYRDAGIDFGVALMPTLSETGKHMRPMFSYFGWAVSKQSQAKVAATRLALALSADEVQVRFAVADFTMPSSLTAWQHPDIASNETLATFRRQSGYGFQPPTTRATALLFEQLDTAMEMTWKGEMKTQEALDEANRTLIRILEQ